MYVCTVGSRRRRLRTLLPPSMGVSAWFDCLPVRNHRCRRRREISRGEVRESVSISPDGLCPAGRPEGDRGRLRYPCSSRADLERERETSNVMQSLPSILDLVSCDDHGRCHVSSPANKSREIECVQ